MKKFICIQTGKSKVYVDPERVTAVVSEIAGKSCIVFSPAGVTVNRSAQSVVTTLRRAVNKE